MSQPARRKSEEGGFALLLIFVLAACVGIYLFMQVPRSAFEAQRIKEQLLMERGYEYHRAVQLYFRKFKHYPQKIEDLEDTSNIRFLRRRYKDPMTGKDEWRILHMGPAGYLTDSLVEKPPQATDKDGKAKDGLGGTASPTGESSPTDTAQAGVPGQQQVSGALIHRPSDTSANAIGTANAQRIPNPNQPFDPNQPNDPFAQQAAGTPPFGASENPNPAVNPNQAANPSQPVNPNQPFDPNQPNNPNQSVNPVQANGNPMQPNPAGAPPFIPGQVSPLQQFPGAPNPAATMVAEGNTVQRAPAGQPATAAPNAALGMINQLLTTPRQPPAGATAGNTTLEMQGGIAGVASKDAEIGIMRYHDRKKYNEWEFVYDYKKDRTLGGGVPGAGQGTGTNPGNTPAAASQTQSGFGQSSFGQSSFGQSSFGQSAPSQSATPQTGTPGVSPATTSQ